MTLTDLFNPTFFMFLGILLLVVALVVVYFENKMRDQNHKIASMLSLVSTLAEDTNRVKLAFNRLSMGQQKPLVEHQHKITVSDDDATEIDDNESEEMDDYTDSDIASDDATDDEDDASSDDGDIKVLKLTIGGQERNDETLELEITDDLDELDEDIHSENSDIQSDVSEGYGEEEGEEVKLEDNTFTQFSASDFKTINIHLEGEPQSESLDFKKLPLNKLRSIVAEKGLSVDAPKLKKNELLKLLEID